MLNLLGIATTCNGSCNRTFQPFRLKKSHVENKHSMCWLSWY